MSRIIQVITFIFFVLTSFNSIMQAADYVKKMKVFKSKKGLEHPIKSPLLKSIGLTLLFFIVFFAFGGWDFIVGYIIQKPVVVTSYAKGSEPKVPLLKLSDTQKKTIAPEPQITKVEYEYIKPKYIPKSIDTNKQVPKYDLKGATIDHSAVGDHSTVNNYGETVNHPTSDLIKQIIDSTSNKETPIFIKYETSQAVKNRVYSLELMGKLMQFGYKNVTVMNPNNTINWGMADKTVIITKSRGGLLLFVTEY